MFRVQWGWPAAVLALVAATAALWPRESGAPAERAARAEGRTIITYWDRSQGHEYDMRRQLVDEFNQSQDRIYVRTLSIGWRIEKLLTAIASGAPPDVCSMENTALAPLAYQGCFEDLTDWMYSSAELHPDRFFAHTIESVKINDRIYGIPTMNDTYCLLWNKQLFRKAGLDPETPPKTIEELEDFAARLTVIDNGSIETIGFLPWVPWDISHLWGVIFGGTWFDDETGLVVCGDDPAIAESYRWQGSWQIQPGDPNPPPHALPENAVSAFFAGSAGGGDYFSATNPFYTGRIAMTVEGEWQCTFIPKYAPDLDWGVAPIPQPEGVEPRSYSPGCVLDAIPVGSPNPEAAREFLEWFYARRAEGGTSPASDYCFLIHNIPTRRDEALESRFMDNPKFRVFVDEILTKPTDPFPTSPATRFVADRIARGREQVLYDGTAPEAVAMEIERASNAEIRRINVVLERQRR